MKAAILEKIDSPLGIREVELTPLKVGQVLVKVIVSGLCGAQLHEISVVNYFKTKNINEAISFANNCASKVVKEKGVTIIK